MMSRICSRIATLIILAIAFCSTETHAQDSGVETVSPSRLTEGLISRNELRRLLKQQTPSDHNPLRRRRLLPAVPIVDHNVRPTAWQEESPAAATAEPPPAVDVPMATTQKFETVPNEPAADDAPAFWGPMPSPEMQNRWDVLDLVADFSVDELKQEIDTLRSKIDTPLGTDQATKNDQLKHLELAESAVQKAIQNIAGKDKYQNRIMTLDESLDRLRLELKEAPTVPTLDDNMPVEAMGLQLRNLQAELTHEKSNLSRIQERIQQRDARMENIPAERLVYRNMVNDYHTKLLQKQASGMSDMEELLSIRAHELSASTKVQMLDQEANWQDLSQEKLPLEKSIHQRRIQQLESDINTWNTWITKRKQHELEKQIYVARQKAFETHPALREFSLETSSLTQARVELAENISTLQNEILKVEKQKHDVEQHFERLSSYKNSLEDGGNEESNSALIEVHRNLIRPWESMARIRAIESDQVLIRGSKLKLREQHDLLSNPASFIREQLEITEDEPVADTTLTAMAESAVESHREQLLALVRDHEETLGLLNKIKTSREDMLKQIAKTRELVDTYALWVQSSEPLDMQVIQKSREGAEKFFDHGQWKDLGSSIVNRMQHRPWECGLGLIGLMVAFGVGRKFQS